MKNRKLLRAAAALLLVGVVGVASVGCSLELEQPEWVTQALCDHVFDEEEVLKEATCTEDGKVQKTCSDCGKTKITTVKATGHDVVDDEAVDATCTTPGLTKGSHCTACGEVLVKQEEVTVDHTYHEGLELYETCTRCETVITPEDIGYTEKAVSQGDGIVGKWVRCYPSVGDEASVEFFVGNLIIYAFSAENMSYPGMVLVRINGVAAPPFSDDCIKYYSNSEAGYIDFFVEAGTITVSGSTEAVTLTENSIIETISGEYERDPVFLVFDNKA